MEKHGELTLLSESSIGSPAAFSTAVKPLPRRENVTGYLSSQGGSNSSPTPNLLRESGRSELNGDSRKGEYSLNESSLDILDLDAIQSDNSAGQLFFGSPLASHSLQLRLSPTPSSPFPRGLSRPPATGTTNAELAVLSTGPSRPSTVSTNGSLMGGLKYSQTPSGGGDSGDSGMAESSYTPTVNAGTSHATPPSYGRPPGTPTPISTSHIPTSNRVQHNHKPFTPESTKGSIGSTSHEPFTPESTKGSIGSTSHEPFTPESTKGSIGSTSHEPFTPESTKGSIGSTSHEPFTPGSTKGSIGSTSHEPFTPGSTKGTFTKTPAPANESLKFASHGSSLGIPSEFLPSFSGSSYVESDSEADTVQSALASALGILGNSTVDGSALLSMGMDATPLSLSARSLPRDPESTRLSPASNSIEGLPSTYLHPQDSIHDDTTDICSSFASHQETVTATGSDTTLVSPLVQSLTEFADMLEDGGGQEKWEGLGRKGEWSELGGKGGLEELGEGMYNPFDPQESVDAELQVDFDEQDSSSFLAQLDKDEGDLKKFNFSQTPPSQLPSFDLPKSSRQASFADSTGEVSISSYFQRRSNEVGDLVPVKLPPQERPHFSPNHVISSPADQNVPPLTPDSIAKATPIKSAGSDVDDNALVLGEETTGQPHPLPLPQDQLTPVVSEHTTLPGNKFSGLPRFTLRDSTSPGQLGAQSSEVTSGRSEGSVLEPSRVVSSATPSSVPPAVPRSHKRSSLEGNLSLASKSSRDTSRYSPIKAPLSPRSGSGGVASPPVSEHSVLMNMQMKLAELRGELEMGSINAEALVGTNKNPAHTSPLTACAMSTLLNTTSLATPPQSSLTTPQSSLITPLQSSLTTPPLSSLDTPLLSSVTMPPQSSATPPQQFPSSALRKPALTTKADQPVRKVVFSPPKPLPPTTEQATPLTTYLSTATPLATSQPTATPLTTSRPTVASHPEANTPSGGPLDAPPTATSPQDTGDVPVNPRAPIAEELAQAKAMSPQDTGDAPLNPRATIAEQLAQAQAMSPQDTGDAPVNPRAPIAEQLAQAKAMSPQDTGDAPVNPRATIAEQLAQAQAMSPQDTGDAPVNPRATIAEQLAQAKAMFADLEKIKQNFAETRRKLDIARARDGPVPHLPVRDSPMPRLPVSGTTVRDSPMPHLPGTTARDSPMPRLPGDGTAAKDSPMPHLPASGIIARGSPVPRLPVGGANTSVTFATSSSLMTPKQETVPSHSTRLPPDVTPPSSQATPLVMPSAISPPASPDLRAGTISPPASPDLRAGTTSLLPLPPPPGTSHLTPERPPGATSHMTPERPGVTSHMTPERPGATSHMTPERPGVTSHLTPERPGVISHLTPTGVTSHMTPERPGVISHLTPERPGVTSHLTPERPGIASHLTPGRSGVFSHLTPKRPVATSHLTPERPGVTSHLTPMKDLLVDFSKILVAESHSIEEVCCVSSTVSDYLPISNLNTHWVLFTFTLTQLHCNGHPLSVDQAVLTLPERSFIGPNQSEPIKMTFHPRVAGNYEAVLRINSSQVASLGRDQDTPTTSIVVKAVAEDPNVELHPSHSDPNLLDFGVLVGGATVGKSLELVNRGLSKVPLVLTVTSENPLAHMYLSFKPLPQSLLLSSPPATPHYPHSLALTLPPQAPGTNQPHVHSIEIYFTAPQKDTTDMTSDLGPPEVVSAQLVLGVDGLESRPLSTLLLRAVMGVARLYVPRSLQAVSLSCPVGRAVTRDVPIKNVGNVPLNIKMELCGGSGDSSHFSLVPTTLHMDPEEESKLSVCFDPPVAPLIIEAQVKIHIEPGGPVYELKLRGTSTDEQQQQQQPPSNGILACNKRYLYWGGVTLGESRQLKLLLHSTFPTATTVSLSIRHSLSPFQLEQKEVTLLPNQESPVVLSFFPFSTSVSISALDIYHQLHSKKYRIPLCGYGGVSRLEVVGAGPSPNSALDTACALDLGEVKAKRGIKFKVQLYNSGPRAAFVQATCCSLDDHAPLPENHAHLIPSRAVVAPHSTQELQLFYRPTQSDEDMCQVSKNPLALLKIQSGDELVRQQLSWSLREGRGSRVSTGYNEFVTNFPQQKKSLSELDLVAFQFHNFEKIFSDHLTTIPVTLLGSAPKPVMPVLQPARPVEDLTPQHSRHALIPSYTPRDEETQGSNVLPKMALDFPRTAIGQPTAGSLEVANPFRDPLNWELTSAPSYVRESAGGTLVRTDYRAFAAASLAGTVPPNTDAKVRMTFDPHDTGFYTQIWTLKVDGPLNLKRNKYKLSCNGEAVSSLAHVPNPGSHDPTLPSPDLILQSRVIPKQESVAQWLFQTQNLVKRENGNVRSSSDKTKRVMSSQQTVYLSDSFVQFPKTAVGGRSMVKVRLCNRDTMGHSFAVIKPPEPFKVTHLNFDLGSRQCARVPVYFSPKHSGEYDAILAVRSSAGHQTFAQLKAKA